MSHSDEFDFVRDLDRPRHRLPATERGALIRLGLCEEDATAIERVLAFFPQDKRKRADAKGAVTAAMLHYRRYGARILDGLGLCFDEILGRDYPAAVGADSIFGKARCDVEGFEINNDLRPFYVRILAARRPNDADRITLCASWADLLIAACWPPIVTAEDGNGPEEPEAVSPPPSPRLSPEATATIGDRR